MKTYRIILPILLAGGCNTADEISREEAVAAARVQLSSDHPRMRFDKLTASSFATGKAWIVRYDPDKDALGGPTTVVVDRRTGEVIAVLGGQ